MPDLVFTRQFPHDEMLKILEKLKFNELPAARLVCRQWNKLITRSVMRNSLKKLRISYNCYPPGNVYIDAYREDYHYMLEDGDVEALRTILQRHTGALTLVIISEDFRIQMLNFSALAAEFAGMRSLRKLELQSFELDPQSVASFQHLRNLQVLKFKGCKLSGKNLHLLGDNIRKLKFDECMLLRKDFVLKAFRSFKARQIPFEVLRLLNINNWNMSAGNEASVTKFCLENFASLKRLSLTETDDLPTTLRTMVANESLEEFDIDFAFEGSVYTNFYAKFFQRPLATMFTLSLVGIDSQSFARCLQSCQPGSLEFLHVFTEQAFELPVEQLLNFKQLVSVNLHIDCGLTFDQLATIIKEMPRLESFEVTGFQVPAEGELDRAMEELDSALHEHPEPREVRVTVCFEALHHSYFSLLLTTVHIPHDNIIPGCVQMLIQN